MAEHLKQQVELRTLALVERTLAGESVEDTLVELKSEFTPPDKVARMIAGQANAAHGEPILWLVGLDEKGKRVTGADHTELATWWAQVEREFDGSCPRILVDKNVAVEGKTVLALLFETDDAPYVVKNPVYGKPGGGSVEREVPWREGRSIRTARRRDLLQILLPLEKAPSVEVVHAEIVVHRQRSDDVHDPQEGASREEFVWSLYMGLYIVPQSQDRLVLPYHRFNGWLDLPGDDEVRTLELGWIIDDGQPDTVRHCTSGVIMTGPGMLTLDGSVRTETWENPPDRCTVHVILPSASGDTQITVHRDVPVRCQWH